MTQGEVIEEITYEQRLYLGGHGHTALTDTERIADAWHGLKEVVLRPCQGEDISQALLRSFWGDIGATVESFHV